MVCVTSDGNLSVGLPVYLVERPYPFADLATLWQLANQKQPIPMAIVNQWTAIDCLDVSWQEKLYKKRMRQSNSQIAYRKSIENL